MTMCFTHPRFRCLILSTLFLFFTKGLSQEIDITYIGPEKINENKQMIFEGFVNTTGRDPSMQISNVVFKENDTAPESPERICDVNFLVCKNTSTSTCYCKEKVDDIYYFVLGVRATEKKTGKCIYAKWKDYNSTAVCYPEIVLQTTVSPTTVASITSTLSLVTNSDTIITGSTDINNTVTQTGTKGDTSLDPPDTTSTTAQTHVDTTSDSTTPKHGEPDSDNLRWIIIGCVVAIVVLGLVALLIYCCCCWLPKKKRDGHLKDGDICSRVFDLTCCKKKSIGVTPRSETLSPTTTTTTFTSEDPSVNATTSPSPTSKPDSLPPLRGERPLPSPRNPNM